MARYKVKESDFETPPENVYFIDLTGIDTKEGKRGPFLRWRWVIADVAEQTKYAGVFVTSITPTMPTVNNRFGQFIKVLTPASSAVGAEVDTDKILDANFRVKAFVEHNKTTNDGEEVIYCNVTKLLENTAQAGAGIGRQEIGAGGKKSDAPAQASKPATQAPAGDGSIPW